MSTTTEVSVAPDRPALPRTPITFEEFLVWADGNTHVEWVDGEIVLMSPNSLQHQDLLDFVNDLVKNWVRAHKLGRVYFAPVIMRLPTRPSGREPDLLFVAAAHADRLKDTYVDGPADLVVEIVSPESLACDRGTKFSEYEGAGIPEYWLIDPMREEAQLYCLGDDGRYHRKPIDADGFYHSVVLSGFRLRVAWLWQRPLPPIAEVIPQTQA